MYDNLHEYRLHKNLRLEQECIGFE
ncbi:hypothetical protein [Nitrosomonas sp. Nm34]